MQTPQQRRGKVNTTHSNNSKWLSSLPTLWACADGPPRGGLGDGLFRLDDDDHYSLRQSSRKYYSRRIDRRSTLATARDQKQPSICSSSKRAQRRQYQAVADCTDGNGEPGRQHLSFTERVRRVATPSSPSKSQSTRATTMTTRSTSSAKINTGEAVQAAGAVNDSMRSIVIPAAADECEKPPPTHPPFRAMTTTTTTSSTTHSSSLAPSLTITTSCSFSDDVSFLSFHHDEEFDESVTSNSSLVREHSQQLQYWRRRASECFDRHGIQHCETATAFLELGMAHVHCGQYTAAQDFFRTALRVFEKQAGPSDLRTAKTLEALGMAQSKGNSKAFSPMPSSTTSSAASTTATTPSSSSSSVNENKSGLLLGLQSFRKCFRIRYDVLGPTHIDTIETLNKIANIYMRLRIFSSAKNDYLEVLTLRSWILGENHPSVAVAAHSLGMAHLQLQQNEQAKVYFLKALSIFALNGIADHPMAAELREDVKTLGFDMQERVEI